CGPAKSCRGVPVMFARAEGELIRSSENLPWKKRQLGQAADRVYDDVLALAQCNSALGVLTLRRASSAFIGRAYAGKDNSASCGIEFACSPGGKPAGERRGPVGRCVVGRRLLARTLVTNFGRRAVASEFDAALWLVAHEHHKVRALAGL